jgi:hypothetical protein
MGTTRRFGFWGGLCGEGEEVAMDGVVAGELRMKRCGEGVAVLDKHGLALMRRKHGEAGAGFLDNWSADEDHFERLFLERAGTEENVAGELAAVPVTRDCHIQDFEGILRGILDLVGEKNGASASAKDGATFAREFANSLVKTFFLEELELRAEAWRRGLRSRLERRGSRFFGLRVSRKRLRSPWS